MPNLSYSLLFAAKAFEAFPDAIIVIDETGVIQKVNDKVFNVFGYKEHEVVGKTIDFLIPERFRLHHNTHIKSFFKNSSTRKMGTGILLSGLHKSGLEFYIDISLNPVETPTANFVLAFIRDISEKIQLQDSINSLNEVKKELENFTYTLTHDLRAPLHKMKGLTSLINMELETSDNEEIKTLVDYVSENVSKLDNLIQGVLTYSSSKIMRSEIKEAINVGEIIDQVIAMIDIPPRFSIIKSNDFPVINANKTAIIQLFMNLISNAISHNNKEKAIIDISWKPDHHHYEFTVADNGKTIPDDIKAQLFDIKQQMKYASDNKNHGFGLSIIREIVMSNKGHRLWVEDNDMGGTSFKFTWLA